MKRSMQTFLLAFCLLLLGSTSAFAQDGEAVTTIDHNVILIGEPIEMTLNLTLPIGATNLVWPEIGDTITENIEVLTKSNYDTTVLGNAANPTAVLHRQQILITSYDSGHFVIPPFQFTFNETTVETEAILITSNVLRVDTALAPKDINEIIELPDTWKEWFMKYWPWISAGGGLLLLLAIVIVLLRRRKKVTDLPKPVKPARPAHETALEALKVLEKQKLWQQGKMKAYHIELSWILWSYLEARFQVVAVEQTTDEILQNLRFVEVAEKNKAELAQILKLGDLVKFAREAPIPSENERCMLLAVQFVQSSIMSNKPPEKKAETGNDHTRYQQ